MSNSNYKKDMTPFLREAGVTTAVGGLSADNSIRQDVYFQPKTFTPEHIKKYRKSLKEIPGQKQVHHGIFNDNKDFETYVHGVKTNKSDHVTDCIKGDNLSGISHFVNQIKENKYASASREPLGESIKRNYEFPNQINDEFKFGAQTKGYLSTKDLIYPKNKLVEDEKYKKMYQRTHGLSDPGEQKDRNYNWYVNKNQHIFGLNQPLEKDGCKKSLRPDLLESEYPKTLIGEKRLEDFRQATSDVVGRSKFKGTLRPDIDPTEYIFGVKSLRGVNWNVGKCISGDPEAKTELMMVPDTDLGKNVNFRSKNNTLHPKECESGRMFGVPSIRTDLPTKNMRSVNDLTVSKYFLLSILYFYPCN